MGKDRRFEIENEIRGKTPDEMLDHFNDALHEAADDLGIPEGDDRDAWRLTKMEDAGLVDGEDFAPNISAVLAAVEDEVRAAKEGGPSWP